MQSVTCHPARPRRRAGLSLYEVLLALGIALASMAILTQYMALGTRAAVTANLRTEAALLCEAKLNEVVAGVEPLQSGSGPLVSSVEGDWTWSMEVVQGTPHVDTYTITLSVDRAETDGSDAVRFTLRRVLRDPLLFEEALATEAVSEEESP